MNVELSQEQVIILRQLVEERIADLGPEIHHTRTSDYAEELKGLREMLKQLDATLCGGQAEAA